MNLLVEGIEKKAVLKTDQVVKLVVDGLSASYPVYQVRLDCLYFNDQNARIATWINQYLSENNVSELSKDDLEKYNSIIQQFLEESNPERMNETQGNIELIGQQKFGVVLKDGRIIDGNRRFCCLRNLAKKKDGFNYFETVILDRDIIENAKQIKMLELQIQLGEDKQVDYDPIEKLVGIYRDIEETHLLTKDEYMRSTNQKKSQVEQDLGTAKLLVEYLDAINAPGQYYIAREMNLNGPLVELYGILKGIKDEDSRQQIKMIVFTNLLIQPVGDMTRFVRKVQAIVKSQYQTEFIAEEGEKAEEILDALPEKTTRETVSAFKADESHKRSLEQTMEKFEMRVKVAESKNKPIELLEKAITNLDAIDLGVLNKLSEDQIEDLNATLSRLEGKISEFKEALNV